ncbi:unnamed protein product [Cercospora beticola]|nr:unnamed protein product [Cercospora beticola]
MPATSIDGESTRGRVQTALFPHPALLHRVPDCARRDCLTRPGQPAPPTVTWGRADPSLTPPTPQDSRCLHPRPTRSDAVGLLSLAEVLALRVIHSFLRPLPVVGPGGP